MKKKLATAVGSTLALGLLLNTMGSMPQRALAGEPKADATEDAIDQEILDEILKDIEVIVKKKVEVEKKGTADTTKKRK